MASGGLGESCSGCRGNKQQRVRGKRVGPVSSAEAHTCARARLLFLFLQWVAPGTHGSSIPCSQIVDKFPAPCGITSVAAAVEDTQLALGKLASEQQIRIHKARGSSVREWTVEVLRASGGA